MARKIFPGGVDATPARRSDNLAAVQRTRQLINEGAEIIYEAAFQHDQVLAILDILVKREGLWFAYEVKSSIKISNTYLLDASLQYWVISNSGLPLDDFSLVTLNSKYYRKGALEPDKLFSISSVKSTAIKNQALVEEHITSSKSVLSGITIPEKAIGEHCFSPYGCDFMGTCWKQVPKNSVFEITGISKTEQFNLYHAGYRTIDEIPDENNLDKNVNIHLKAVRSGEAFVNKKAITDFLGRVVYPVCFMDFETYMPAIPVYEGTKPYQHIPFQYSVHIINSPGSEFMHKEFLAEQGTDPREQFLSSLLKDTEGSGSILVYDALMEKNVLNGLKNDFPKFTQEIDQRLKRIVDLVQPFQERSFYHPSMKNSVSMKSILPALVPDLNYHDLKISSGSIAMIAFEQLQNETDMFKAMETRENLLAYCAMDTLAMVKMFEVLRKQVQH